MKTLIETIDGISCGIYAVSHHERIKVTSGVPKIEIYEECTELCKGVRYCWNSFSVKVCPGDVAIDDRLRGLSAFELCMELCRGDGCAVPFDLYGVTSAELTPEEWVFNITDAQAVKRLRQCEA